MVQINMDEYPKDIDWTLTNTCTQTILGSRSPGYYGGDDKTYTETICLSSAESYEYEFDIEDEYGDGLCCASGKCCAAGFSNYKVFVNGVQQGSTATVSTDITSTYGVSVGATNGTPQYQLNGYIQDLRVTKGYARYTSNFTPPTAAFPTL